MQTHARGQDDIWDKQFSGVTSHGLQSACSAGVFWVIEWAKACSCSYCCSRHLWFYDRGRLGREEIVTVRVGATAKEGKGERGRGEKIRLPDIVSSLSLPPPRPLPAPFGPICSSLREVATWRFREQKHSRARRKRLHCRLGVQWENKTKGLDKRDNAQKVMEMYDGNNNNIHGDMYLQFFQ